MAIKQTTSLPKISFPKCAQEFLSPAATLSPSISLQLRLCTIFAPYDDFMAFAHIGTFDENEKKQKKTTTCVCWYARWGAATTATRMRTSHKKLSTCFGIPTWLFDYHEWIWHVHKFVCIVLICNSFRFFEINRVKGCGKVKHFWDNFCVPYIRENRVRTRTHAQNI